MLIYWKTPALSHVVDALFGVTNFYKLPHRIYVCKFFMLSINFYFTSAIRIEKYKNFWFFLLLLWKMEVSDLWVTANCKFTCLAYSEWLFHNFTILHVDSLQIIELCSRLYGIFDGTWFIEALKDTVQNYHTNFKAFRNNYR